CSRSGTGQAAPANTGRSVTASGKLPLPVVVQVLCSTVPTVVSPAPGSVPQLVLLVTQITRAEWSEQPLSPVALAVQLTVSVLAQSSLATDPAATWFTFSVRFVCAPAPAAVTSAARGSTARIKEMGGLELMASVGVVGPGRSKPEASPPGRTISSKRGAAP